MRARRSLLPRFSTSGSNPLWRCNDAKAQHKTTEIKDKCMAIQHLKQLLGHTKRLNIASVCLIAAPSSVVSLKIFSCVAKNLRSTTCRVEVYVYNRVASV